MAANNCDSVLKLVSFNMHGFFQGHPVMEDLISDENPDIIFAQEHWLTPANLNKVELYFNDFSPLVCQQCQLRLSPACYEVDHSVVS